MQLSHYMTPESIVVPLKATTKLEVLEELVTELSKRTGIANPKSLLHAIEEREACSSTFLPMGVAVPHARVPEVSDITMIAGIAPEGIMDAGDPSSLTAHVFCLFFSSTEEKEFGKHLKLLARMAAVFSDPDFVAKISHMTKPDQIFSAIQKRERQIEKE